MWRKATGGTGLAPQKEDAVNRAFGIVLIALGLFGLAWEVLRKRPGKRLSPSGRFTLPATGHIM